MAIQITLEETFELLTLIENFETASKLQRDSCINLHPVTENIFYPVWFKYKSSNGASSHRADLLPELRQAKNNLIKFLNLRDWPDDICNPLILRMIFFPTQEDLEFIYIGAAICEWTYSSQDLVPVHYRHNLLGLVLQFLSVKLEPRFLDIHHVNYFHKTLVDKYSEGLIVARYQFNGSEMNIAGEIDDELSNEIVESVHTNFLYDFSSLRQLCWSCITHSKVIKTYWFGNGL